jgi:hypothetical protein
MRDRPRKEFLLPDTVQEKARQFGVPPAKLQEMLRHSVRITHPLGNRRYNDYLFMVEGFLVLSVGRVTDIPPPVAALLSFKCEACKDTGRMPVFDQCEHCEGVGCSHCDEGLVPATIPCPSCQKGKRRG